MQARVPLSARRAALLFPTALLPLLCLAPATAQQPGSEKPAGTGVVEASGSAQGSPAKLDRGAVPVFWEPSIDAALERAARLGRPVLIALHKPSSPLSQHFLREVYPAALVRPLLRELVCVAASTEATAPLTEGPRAGKSVVFRTVTSAEAQAAALAVGARYLGDEVSKAPIHVFVDAKGHMIRSASGRLKQREFLALVQDVLDKSDPSWRPAALVAKAGGKKGGDADAAPFAGLFSDDEKAQGRAIKALLASTDKSIVAGIFAQIPSASAKSKLLEAARRREGDRSWMSDVLEHAIRDRDPTVRAQAAVTAESAKLPGLLPALLDAHKSEKDPGARAELLRALAASARGDKRVWSLLGSAIKDKSDRARGMAYVAYARFGEADDKLASRAVDVLLRRGLRERDNTARNAAVWSLGHLRSKRATKDIEKLLKKARRGQTRRFYQKVLSRIRGEKVGGWEESRRIVARETIRR